MFRAIILPIFRITRLCVTACGIMHPRCCRPATSWVHYTTSCNTQSSAPEDGRNHRPKHVELIGIINKPLLLHLVGCLHYCITSLRSRTFRVKALLLVTLHYVKFAVWPTLAFTIQSWLFACLSNLRPAVVITVQQAVE